MKKSAQHRDGFEACVDVNGMYFGHRREQFGVLPVLLGVERSEGNTVSQLREVFGDGVCSQISAIVEGPRQSIGDL